MVADSSRSLADAIAGVQLITRSVASEAARLREAKAQEMAEGQAAQGGRDGGGSSRQPDQAA